MFLFLIVIQGDGRLFFFDFGALSHEDRRRWANWRNL
jgi:hypothetical protein